MNKIIKTSTGEDINYKTTAEQVKDKNGKSLQSFFDNGGSIGGDITLPLVGGVATGIQTNTAEINAIKNSVAQNKPIVITDDTPIGTIVLRNKTSVTPNNWLVCDGSAVSKTDYADLYAVVGDTYGSTSTTFNLPNIGNGNSAVVMSDSGENYMLTPLANQRGYIKAKSLQSTGMTTVAQEWETFKTSGGEINKLLIGTTPTVNTSDRVVSKNLGLIVGRVDPNNTDSYINGIEFLANEYNKGFMPVDPEETVGFKDYPFKGLYLSGGATLGTVDIVNGNELTDGIQTSKELMAIYNNTGGLVVGQHVIHPTVKSQGKMNIGNGDFPFEGIYLSNKAIGATGYSKLPNNLLIQWGQSTITIPKGSGKSVDLTFPIAFKTACLDVRCEPIYNQTNATSWGAWGTKVTYSNLSVTKATIHGVDTGNTVNALPSGDNVIAYRWFALGY